MRIAVQRRSDSGHGPPAARTNAERDPRSWLGHTGQPKIAALIFTGGTTGLPKAAQVSHRMVAWNTLNTVIHDVTHNDTYLNVFPMFHTGGLFVYTLPQVIFGGTTILIRAFDPALVLSLIEREKVTITNLIPTMLYLMVNHPEVGKYSYRSLRALLSGGAPIAPEVVRKIVETFQCDYIQTYGMTETSPYLTLSILKEHLKKLSYEDQLRFKSKTGREFIGVQLKVVNEKGEEIRADEKEVGEIIVKGDIVTKGYWKLPDETAKAIRDGWHYTGDMAVIDASCASGSWWRKALQASSIVFSSEARAS